MATQSQAPAPQSFTINLNIQANGDVDATGPFQNQMIVGDTARFVASKPGNITIEFISIHAVDINNKTVPSDLLPFGVDKIVNPGPTQSFQVVNSCRAWMAVTIVTGDGISHQCPWGDGTQTVKGSTVCTGGGNNPVNCH